MFFKRKAILMIHGFVGGNYDFKNFHNELELVNKFDVFTFTLPAHEKTIVSGAKYTDWINEAKFQMDTLLEHGYKDIYVIGHSMGGVIASYLASTYLQVKKLVLAAPAFRYFGFKDGKMDIKNFTASIKNFPAVWKGEESDQITSRIIKTPLPTIIEFTKLVDKYQNCVKDIKCPTLIIHGLNDYVVPVEATTYVYDNITSNTNILLNVKNVNHGCFVLPEGAILRKTIKDFLIKKPKKGKRTIEL